MSSLRLAIATPSLLVLGASTASAQEPLPFTIDQGASTWMWSGTTSLGPLLGNPSQDFAVSGTMNAIIEATTIALGSGQITSGVANVVPDLSGRVPNPIPGFPDLATVDITGLSLDFASTPFTIAANGSFSTMITVTALSGTLTVTPLIGSQTMTDLAGVSGAPQPASGTVTQAGGVISFSSPQSSQFDFMDMTSGISATLNLDGTLAGDYACPAPANYCATSPNSVGAGAIISVAGSTSIFDDDFTLEAGPVPNQPGIFFYGASQIMAPFGNGNLCIGSPVSRLDVEVGAGNVLSHDLDLVNTQAGFGIASGVTWNFQAWYRDPADGGAFFNLSDGTEVTFCP